MIKEGKGQAGEPGPIHRGRKGRGLHENAATGDFGCEQGHVGYAGNAYPNVDAANVLADQRALTTASATMRSVPGVAGGASMPNCLI